jgi:hypothetical protein
MKTKVKGLLLIGSIVCLSVNSFSQYDENTTETKSKKNSIHLISESLTVDFLMIQNTI